MVVITAEALPPRDRFEYWREVLSRQFVNLRLEREGTSQFHCEIEAKTIDGLVAMQSLCSGGTAHLTDAEIADSPVSRYVVNVHLGGPAAVCVGEETTALAPGDIFFTDTLREYAFGGEQLFKCMAVMVPKEWIDARVPRPDLIHGSIVRRDNALARMLTGYLRSGFEMAEDLTTESASLFAAHSVELLARALGGAQSGEPAPSIAMRDALFVRACRIIAVKCGDPRLAPERIASELGISARSLHRIFAERRETVMKHVFAERVSRAAKLLAAPEARHRSITEIAFACGFNDSAHFSRAFAERMHLTASQWRKQARH
jgi:AraC family transcriptional activator of tynA and feaB